MHRKKPLHCRWEETIAKSIISLPAALFLPLGLASCGGGANLIIDPSAAQSITGGSAPVESAASQTARALNLASRSDSLLFSTVHLQTTVAGYRDLPTDVSCTPTYCSVSIPSLNFSATYTANSISNSAFSGSRRTQSVLTEHGITLVERAWMGTLASGGVELPNQGNSLVAVQSHSAFGSATESIFYQNHRFDARYSVAFGDRAGIRPAASGVWRGQMTAITRNADNFLQGDANVVYTVSSTGGELSADFTDIKNLSSNAPHEYSSARFRNIFVSSNGTYSRGYRGNRIQGAFYGSGSVETAGTFEQNGMLGAFGAQR